MAQNNDLLEQAQDLLRAAKAAGADVAETVMGFGTSISVQRRLGKIEETERAEMPRTGLARIRRQMQRLGFRERHRPRCLRTLGRAGGRHGARGAGRYLC